MKLLYTFKEIINLADNKNFGRKADGLVLLRRNRIEVPKSFFIPFSVFDSYSGGDMKVVEELKKELGTHLSENVSYAIRSSSNLEDGEIMSSAGVFKSFLNVKGIDEILKSVFLVMDSIKGERVDSYISKFNLNTNGLKMGVIIQEMVQPEFSGVIFTKNPLTGLNEVIIECVEGSGENLLQKGQSPFRWIFRHGEFLSNSNNGCLKNSVIKELVDKSLYIGNHLKKSLDLEWVYNGSKVFFVQMRNITSISGNNIYSNSISREFMPGIIKPLVWSINIPLVNGAWKKLFTKLIGKNEIKIDELAKSYYGRAYFNMGVIGDIFEMLGIPRDGLEVLLGFTRKSNYKKLFKPSIKTLKYLPNLLSFLMFLMIKVEKEIKDNLEKSYAEYQECNISDEISISEESILNTIEKLFQISQRMAYYNILGQLLNAFYHKRFLSISKKEGVDIKQDFSEDISDINPNYHIEKLNNMYDNLSDETKEKIKKVGYNGLISVQGIDEFRVESNKFFDRFGHLSESGNDFSVQQWGENKNNILGIIIKFKKSSKTPNSSGFDSRISRKLSKTYSRYRKFQIYKEMISFNYTCGYSLFRKLFLKMGEMLAEKGFLTVSEDIFYLSLDEIRNFVKEGRDKDFKEIISERKSKLIKYEKIKNIPSIIYTDYEPPIPPDECLKKLEGVPTSGGYYRGRVKVLEGLQDFSKVDNGDVIVIPFSDIGWSPVFAKSGAVISQSGGILSHSSIIAREYEIPAVVSVENACSTLKDDDFVYVNGYDGYIFIEDKGKNV